MLTITTAGATMTSREIASKKKRSNTKGLYLCLFDQGTLKIGMGGDAESRLSSHKGAGAVFGISVVRTDIIQCDSAAKGEKILIEWCRKNGSGCTGREWFSGVDYDACLAAARDIASSMMGPHPFHAKGKCVVDSIIDYFKKPGTKEADFYSEARPMMIAKGMPLDVVAGFDYLHNKCEQVRQGIRLGCSMPAWYDELNSFETMELELLMDCGSPNSDLIRAAADAIGAIINETTADQAGGD